MRKRDVLAIVENPTRSRIIMRLEEAGKAAYSDLLDSAGPIEALDSRGNFNYHLNFLLENSIAVKEGVVYRLTDKGRAIVQFVKEVDQAWKQVEPKLGGDYMSVLGYAEDFENETGIKMQKRLGRKPFGVSECVMDEAQVLGIVYNKDCKGGHFEDFEVINSEDLKLVTQQYKWQGSLKKRRVLGHPALSYYLSPYYFGAILRYMEHLKKDVELLAVSKE